LRSGKTTLVKHIIRSLNKKVIVAYVDCSLYQTTYSILKEILPRSEFVLYRSNYELIKELLKYAREKRFAVCFDNFEKLKEKDLIARLMSLNLCIILISDNEENLSLLSESIRSNIPSIIRLQAYTIEQSFDILKDRDDISTLKFNDSTTWYNYLFRDEKDQT